MVLLAEPLHLLLPTQDQTEEVTLSQPRAHRVTAWLNSSTFPLLATARAALPTEELSSALGGADPLSYSSSQINSLQADPRRPKYLVEQDEECVFRFDKALSQDKANSLCLPVLLFSPDVPRLQSR